MQARKVTRDGAQGLRLTGAELVRRHCFRMRVGPLLFINEGKCLLSMASRLPCSNCTSSWSCTENAKKNCKHEQGRADHDDASLATHQLCVLGRDDKILVLQFAAPVSVNTCASQSLIASHGAI